MRIRFERNRTVSPDGGVGAFVEVEDDRGRSIRAGRWELDGPHWLLRLDAPALEEVKAGLVTLARAAGIDTSNEGDAHAWDSAAGAVQELARQLGTSCPCGGGPDCDTSCPCYCAQGLCHECEPFGAGEEPAL